MDGRRTPDTSERTAFLDEKLEVASNQHDRMDAWQIQVKLAVNAASQTLSGLIDDSQHYTQLPVFTTIPTVASGMTTRFLRSLYFRFLAIFMAIGLVLTYLGPVDYIPSFSSVRPLSHDDTAPRFWTLTDHSLETSRKSITTWTKPANLSVVAIIFYGRPVSVSILDCYLKRNLVKNGGLLDEVIFIARTKEVKDLYWLNALVAEEPAYTRRDLNYTDAGPRKDFRSAWDNLRNDTMYIKIDDDIVFFEDSTIPSIVKTRLEHPEYFLVSANIINQPSLAWVHRAIGTVKPYLPELEPPPYMYNESEGTGYQSFKALNTTITLEGNYTQSWRDSELPYWTGPNKYHLIENYKPPFLGQRWLPIDPASNMTLDNTPISIANYDAFGTAWSNWTLGAQQHYSFFSHLEHNTLSVYKSFDTWDYWYARLGIQFMAVMGSDVWLARNQTDMDLDDEYWFSEEMARRTRRHAVIDGKAIATHFAFGTQREMLMQTDILDRYRAFANEKICVPSG